MGELKQFDHDNAAVVRKPEGNPEGKGLNGFLLDWYQTEPRGIVAKPRRQILAELFTSMLVLSASFKFRPAVGIATYSSKPANVRDQRRRAVGAPLVARNLYAPQPVPASGVTTRADRCIA